MTWRESARPIIARVIKETAGQSDPDVRRALRDAYPWGERAHWPYKIWCDEVRIQRGLKLVQPRRMTRSQRFREVDTLTRPLF